MGQPMGVDRGHVICFLRREGELLCLNRRHPPHMGLWTGVGGKIEPGEIPLAAALRETREETGLALTEARFAGTVTWELSSGVGGMFAFVADAPRPPALDPPRRTAEGILAWQPLAWLLASSNHGVAPHVQRILPDLLRCSGADHRFSFPPGAGSTDWTAVRYVRLLPGTPG